METDPQARPDPDEDRLVQEESELAAAEAGAIGGRREGDEDPAMTPVVEGGGGVAEGFEQAEELLRRHAEHDDAAGDPLADRGRPEEAHEEPAYGEADQVISTETEDDTGATP